MVLDGGLLSLGPLPQGTGTVCHPRSCVGICYYQGGRNREETMSAQGSLPTGPCLTLLASPGTLDLGIRFVSETLPSQTPEPCLIFFSKGKACVCIFPKLRESPDNKNVSLRRARSILLALELVNSRDLLTRQRLALSDKIIDSNRGRSPAHLMVFI